jgi:excisionase family DNA binding protein
MSAADEGVQDELLTVKETARIFKVSVRTIWRWIKRGGIECVKFQGIVRIRRSEIERILKGE